MEINNTLLETLTGWFKNGVVTIRKFDSVFGIRAPVDLIGTYWDIFYKRKSDGFFVLIHTKSFNEAIDKLKELNEKYGDNNDKL